MDEFEVDEVEAAAPVVIDRPIIPSSLVRVYKKADGSLATEHRIDGDYSTPMPDALDEVLVAASDLEGVCLTKQATVTKGKFVVNKGRMSLAEVRDAARAEATNTLAGLSADSSVPDTIKPYLEAIATLLLGPQE
jgi:hypothetical protein